MLYIIGISRKKLRHKEVNQLLPDYFLGDGAEIYTQVCMTTQLGLPLPISWYQKVEVQEHYFWEHLQEDTVVAYGEI